MSLHDVSATGKAGKSLVQSVQRIAKLYDEAQEFDKPIILRAKEYELMKRHDALYVGRHPIREYMCGT